MTAYPELGDWGAVPQHATGDDAVPAEDFEIVVVDDDFSNEPTRPDIDVGVSRRKTEKTMAIITNEDAWPWPRRNP